MDDRRNLAATDSVSVPASTASTESAREIHGVIRASLQEFIGEREPGDDSTLIVLKF